METTIDKVNGFQLFTREGAEALVAALSANEAGEADAWSYEVREHGPHFLVAAIDEDGFFVGHL